MKICKQCNKEFDSTKGAQAAVEHGISEPVYCRLCSWQRKLAFENEYNVYKRKCDATGKGIVSVYKEDVLFPVFERNYWVSDDWDLPEMDYDESRSFFEQYAELYSKVPRPSANCVNAENSEYAHLVFDSKNAYLSFQVFLSDRVVGCYRVVKMKDSINCFFCTESELLCECANCHKSYNLKFCEDSEDCSDSAFLFDCRGCRDCFMSFNQRNKQYLFKNQQLSKEEYEKKIAEYDLETKEGLVKARSEFEEIRSQFIVKASHQINCENCEGDYIVDCKGCDEIYFSDGCEDSSDILRGTEDINSFDAVVGGKIELCYNVLQPGYSYKCAYGISNNHSNYVYLSEYCDYCDDCIGCISLKRGKYRILNKEYTEEEYKRLAGKIFEELKGGGFEQFFNPLASPFKYEETIADLYFPKSEFSGERSDNGDGKCGYCAREMQNSEVEVKMYKKMGVYMPETCFNCRIQNISRPYSVVEMEKGECEECGSNVMRGKSSRKFGKLHCEKCYLEEVY